MTPHPATRLGLSRNPREDTPQPFRHRPGIYRARIVAVLAAVALAWPAVAPAGLTSKRSAAPDVPAASTAATVLQQAPGVDRSVVRQQPVALDLRALDPQTRDAPAKIDVQLFDGQVVTLERHRVESRGANNYTWYGWIAGQDTGQAILTVVNGKMAGQITTFDGDLRNGKVYQILSEANGTLSLRQIDQAGFPPDHPAGAEVSHAAPAGPASSGDTGGGGTASGTTQSAEASADTGGTIDVMVVYSNQTAAAAGTAIDAQIQQAVDTANAIYANSGIGTRLRLVYTQQVNYNESGDFATDLNRLTSGSDGYMDEVASLRNTYSADLVSLFVENTQACGVAWIGPSASYGFSVINRGCASANYSYAHELGHNFGARHDTYVDASTTPYAYGHGMTDATAGWRTVMAYNNACTATGMSCPRIAYFSTPNLTYGDPPHALGTAASADNVRVHNDSAVTVANFRVAGSTTTCSYSLSPTSASVAAAGGTGSATLTTGTGCAWTASSSANWLTVSTAASGTGSATIGWSAAANTGSQRSANLSIGGLTFTVTEAAATTTASTTAPIATLSATSVKFGTIKVGTTTAAKTITLTNAGGGTLTIASFAAGGANPGDFARSGTCAVNTALSGGQSCTLQHTFTPGASGNRSASLAVGTSAGTVNVGLSGRGSTK